MYKKDFFFFFLSHKHFFITALKSHMSHLDHHTKYHFINILQALNYTIKNEILTNGYPSPSICMSLKQEREKEKKNQFSNHI